MTMVMAFALRPYSPFSVRSSFPSSFPLEHSRTRSLSTAFASSPSCSSLKLKATVPRASTDGGPTELIEDSKFVPLSNEDPQYGPPALLLLGFEVEEATKIKQLLKEIDGEFLQIIFCTEDMITRSLWEAVHTKQPDLKLVKIRKKLYIKNFVKRVVWNDGKSMKDFKILTEEQVAKQVPRICFLSGLTGEEMMMLIDVFPETGLEPAVFAALVPNSADKLLEELIDEIMGDHEMLTGEQSD